MNRKTHKKIMKNIRKKTGGKMRKGHQFTVVEHSKKFMAVIVISEHDTMEEAMSAMLDAMNTESEEITKEQVEEQRARGINTVTLQEAIKDMTPEELKRFMEERQRKFVNPILDANLKMLETKGRRLKIKRIK